MASSIGLSGSHPSGNTQEEPPIQYDLNKYRRIVLLTDGFSSPFYAKTAINLLRYRGGDVVGVLDVRESGKTAEELFGTGGSIPVVATLDDVAADAVFVGVAFPGGALPAHFRDVISDAVIRGWDVVSGLHDFLIDDPRLKALADKHGAQLIDVRKNDQRQTAKGLTFSPDCLRILTVGQDCTVGKMVVTLEVQRALEQRGGDARFLATGQTGIMISGDGVPIDCVVADFVNGAAEQLVKSNEHHDILLIEGQGSISHPSFSAVTLGLLHGCAPDGLIFCYEFGRESVKGLGDLPLLPIRTMIEAYELNAALRHPARTIGIAINSRNATDEEAARERERIESEFGLPACDVYRDGPGVLVYAVLKLKQQLHN